VFLLGKPFQTRLVFASKTMVYPSEVPFSPGLTHKCNTRMKSVAKDKYSSLLTKVSVIQKNELLHPQQGTL